MSSSHTPRSRSLPRSVSSATAFRHCTKSFRTVSRKDIFLFCDRRTSCSRTLVVEPVLSWVRTRSSPVMLLSLRMAAASRSGQSERLTNSNWASAMSSIAWAVTVLRREADERGRSKGATSSLDGVGIDSRKRSRDAATLRPMPALTGGGMREVGELGDDDEEDGEGERRDRGRPDEGGDMVNNGSDVDIRGVCKVRAFSEALRTARFRGWG